MGDHGRFADAKLTPMVIAERRQDRHEAGRLQMGA